MIPVLLSVAELGSRFVAYGIDISPVAVGLLKQKVEADERLRGRVSCLVHDLATSAVSFGEGIPHPVRFGSLIFVLSAVPRKFQKDFVENVAKLVVPGGAVFFRDYADDDHAARRFSERSRVGSKAFARSNGTLSTFFTEEEVKDLFEASRFTTISTVVVERDVSNRKSASVMRRRFLQATFSRAADPQ
jgi:SAM-dependent methyltransferase